VRRLLAISLLLLFGMPLISPLFALAANTESNLPACCRRNGSHHCMMSMAERDHLANKAGAHAPMMGERCPYLPKALPVASSSPLFALNAAMTVFSVMAMDGIAVRPSFVARRVLHGHSGLQRGPPVFHA
jgi:hypothetical protein